MQDGSISRTERFESANALPANRYMAMKREREASRQASEADDLAPRALAEAVSLKGSCMDMCPAFEREEREYQNNVDPLEMVQGQQPGTQRRIDHKKAVKAYHRPAAGVQPIAEDIRPPEVLKTTLDYLFHNILEADPMLEQSHPFLRDRTRAIRQDFTIQHDKGLLAIECNERIARFHIYCLHVMRGKPGYSESQELEQLRKVLQTLTELYDDAHHTELATQLHNEAELRAYHLLIHLRDPEVLREAELLPHHIFFSAIMQHAFRLHSLAQRNNAPVGRGRPANTPACLNGFSRFFKLVEKQQTSFLLACVLQISFHNIREGALKALRTAYRDAHAAFPIDALTRMLGCDDFQECADVCKSFEIEVGFDEAGQPAEARLARTYAFVETAGTQAQTTQSQRLVEHKRGEMSVVDIINGMGTEGVMPPAPRALKTFSKAKGLSPMAQSFQPRSVSAGKSTLKPASPKATSNSTPSAFAAFLTPSATPSPSIQPQAQPNQSASSFSFKPLPPSSSTPVSSSSASQGLSTLSQATLSTPQKRKASYNAPPLEIPVASTSKLSTPPSTGKHIRLATQQRQPASPPPLTPKTAKPKVTYQDPAKLIQELAQRLAEEMLESMVHIDLQLLVADVLTHQEFKEDTRIQSALDRRCGTAATHLLEPLIEDCMAEIVLSVQSDRNILKRAFKRWIRARQKRQSHFREMSRADSRSWVEVASTSLSIVDSLPLGKSSITEDIDMDASMALDFAQSKREAFWRAQSFARLLEAHVDQLFAHAHPSKKPQWDTIISVGESLQSVAGMWYRHKLGIDPQGIATGLQCRRTETDVRLADSDSFLSMAADHLGLVVFDLASEETKSQRQKRFQSLSDRCLALSSYNPALLFVAWPMKNETSAACLSRLNSTVTLPKLGYSSIAWLVVDPAKVDERFDRALGSLLGAVQLNRRSLATLSLHACFLPFVQLWRKNYENLIQDPQFNLGTHAFLVKRAVDLLYTTLERLEKAAYGHSTISVPPLSLPTGPKPLKDALVAFVNEAKLQDHLNINLLIFSSPKRTLLLLGQVIAAGLCAEVSRAPFEMSAAFGAVVDALSAFFQTTWAELRVIPTQGSTPKKRNVVDLSSEGIEQEPRKRVKKENKSAGVESTMWTPQSITALQKEIKAAKSLLTDIRSISLDDSDSD